MRQKDLFDRSKELFDRRNELNLDIKILLRDTVLKFISKYHTKTVQFNIEQCNAPWAEFDNGCNYDRGMIKEITFYGEGAYPESITGMIVKTSIGELCELDYFESGYDDMEIIEHMLNQIKDGRYKDED